MSEQPTATLSTQQLTLQVGAATLTRLFLNTARRFPYTFAPALSRALGVEPVAITSMLAINQGMGLVGVVIGPLTDGLGYRRTMIAGLGMLAVGMLAVGLLPFYLTVLIALLLAGLGKTIFDPALQAYVGQYVPYHRRGLVIGVIEFSWAGASLVGIPIAGLLIDGFGWQAPFVVLGGLGLLSSIALLLLFPHDQRMAQSGQAVTVLLGAWQQLLSSTAAVGALGFSFFVAIAQDNLFATYGFWFENSFALSVVALGTVTTVIGVAELIGEGLTATIADRIGLVRAIAVAIALCGVSFALLPFISVTLTWALVGLFFVFVTIEFAIVTSISLFTEVLPSARATMMAGYLASASLGRVVGAFISGFIWQSGGIVAVSLTSSAAMGLALICLLWGMRSRD